MRPLAVMLLAITLVSTCAFVVVQSEPSPGSPNGQDSYAKPTPSAGSSKYEGGPDAYGQRDACPQPQSADWFDNAYEKHYTFNWAELAAEVAAEGSQATSPKAPKIGTTPPGSQKDGPKTRLPSSFKLADRAKARTILPTDSASKAEPRASQQPAQGGGSANKPAAGQGSNLQSTAAGSKAAHVAGAAPHSGNKGASAGHSSANKVHPSYVTNPKFPAPTGAEESGRGFNGTWDINMPTDASLAVGPHPDEPENVLVLHGVKRAFEIFAATRDGRQLPTEVPTKIGSWQIANKMGYTMGQADEGYTTILTNAFYDLKEGRYVIAFGSYWYGSGPDDAPPPPIFICASAGDNPLGQWTCWALSATLFPQIYAPFCAGQPGWAFVADLPQISYSDDGIFASIVGICVTNPETEDAETIGFLSALFAFPKKALYFTPPTDAQDVKVYRATYLPSSSWYRSLSADDQLLIYDPDYPNDPAFNSYVLPSRPIQVEDVGHPIFVMGKPDGGRYMSFARLTDEPLDQMDSRQTAPRIIATVISKGVDFRNAPGFPDGNPVIPQPGDVPPLRAGDVGLYGATYGASHHRGLVYVATQEYFGVEDNRVPSIYWAIVDPSQDLCKPSLEDWGLLASEQGLVLAYPVIVPRDCGALLAYVYGGNTTVTLAGQRYPAYAGVASSIVGCRHEETIIGVVKRGERLIDRRPEVRSGRWGDFSAFQVLGDTVWFAASIALDTPLQYGSWIWAETLGNLDASY